MIIKCLNLNGCHNPNRCGDNNKCYFDDGRVRERLRDKIASGSLSWQEADVFTGASINVSAFIARKS